MALTINEGTDQKTLYNIPGAGFPVGYVNLMRFMIDANRNFNIEYRRYYSEDERRANPDQTPGLIGIGAQINEEDYEIICKIAYKYGEAQINIEAVNQVRQKEIESLPEGDNADEIKAINEKAEADILKVRGDFGI